MLDNNKSIVHCLQICTNAQESTLLCADTEETFRAKVGIKFFTNKYIFNDLFINFFFFQGTIF